MVCVLQLDQFIRITLHSILCKKALVIKIIAIKYLHYNIKCVLWYLGDFLSLMDGLLFHFLKNI